MLDRDGWVCKECGQAIQGRQAHVHHKLPRALGGPDAEENLISLCDRCHSQKHMALHVSLGRKFLEGAAVKAAKLFGGSALRSCRLDNLGVAMRYLGVKRLRPNQIQPIISAISGKDLLLISPTGSGKSLCFQIPALLSEQHSLVISPLKALMVDQVQGLLNRSFPATFLNSDISKDERGLRVALIERGLFKLIYLAPERLKRSVSREAELKALYETRPSYLVVDEAHCIERWGDAFRPAYAMLGQVREALGRPTVLAFTATANKATRLEIVRSLKMNDPMIFVEDLDRPNLAILRMQVHQDHERIDLIRRMFVKLSNGKGGRTLVFVATRKQGELVSQLLRAVDVPAHFFHGRLPAMDRERILNEFMADSNGAKILVCTNAFGMGMDLPDIRLVFHWHHPASIEDYAQEFGRAGRDGKQSLAVLFTKSDDEKLLKFMAAKTVAGSHMSAEDREIALAKRNASIAEMRTLATDRSLCFNQNMLNLLGEEKLQLPKVSQFFLNLAFGQNRRSPKRQYCCDGCWRKTSTSRVSEFGFAVLDHMSNDGRGKVAIHKPLAQPNRLSARGRKVAAHFLGSCAILIVLAAFLSQH